MVKSYAANLGRIKAQCIVDKKLHVCNADCAHCNTYHRLHNCYEQLDDYHKLLVDDNARSYIPRLEELTRHEIRQRKNTMYKRVVLIIIAVLVLLTVCTQSCHAYTRTYDNYIALDEEICATLKRTHSQVHDVDGDGKVNCVDYAVIFKRQWDRYYDSKRCEIVRNNNSMLGWYHLFVICLPKNDIFWWHVEPQADADNYEMLDYWYASGKYNPLFNVYGETQYWLSRGNR